MAVQGLFISRTSMVLAAIGAFVVLPMLMLKAGIENAYTDFFGNPFTSFVVVFLIGVLLMFKYIKGNIFYAAFLLTGISIIAYLYVYTLLL